MPINADETIVKIEEKDLNVARIMMGGEVETIVTPQKDKTQMDVLEEINSKLDMLLMKLGTAFGNYGLVNGKFVNLSKSKISGCGG